MPIRAAHLARVAVLPWVHRDRLGRLLVAQAAEEELIVLTVDETLRRHGRFVKPI